MPPELQQDTQQSSWRLHLPETLQAQHCCVTKIMPTAHQSSGACKGDVMSCKRKLAMFILPPFLPWNGACPCCWWVSFGHEDKDEWKNGKATRKGEPGSSQAQGAERPGVPDDPKLGKAVTQALIAELRPVWRKGTQTPTISTMTFRCLLMKPREEKSCLQGPYMSRT